MLKLKSGKTIHPIGDPHLGRRFLTNVPLSARGIKEKQLADAYTANLNTKADIICMMGDLFDKFDVPNAVILFAFEELERAAYANFQTIYIFNKGNHDESRDISKKSSYQLFYELVEKAELPNVLVVNDRVAIYKGIGVVPWSPFKSASQMVEELKECAEDMGVELEYILTHNDVSTYGSDSDTHNLMAFDQLRDLGAVVLNGHVHQPSEKDYDGLKVINVGSMLPLGFQEDSTGNYYVTLTLEEFEKADKTKLQSKSVRVLLRPDEEAPEPIECLQFKTKRVNEDGGDEVGQVVAEDFELKALYDESMVEVGKPLREDIWNNLKDNL